ncbi:hypothetical protein SANA_24860 [Gottschalkiaceae bacterium SANA]|jgi:hypothetical protein|nr:hypothetical protein SANA_22820 [Gottschalkiaceae bacterium SANA]BES66047.1 hypothetical protein SANA_24860 [Gottschalkiaceae bacterium SANA]
MKLTDALANQNSRVTALEGADFNSNSTIARITKFYGDLKVTMSVKLRRHKYHFASSELFPSDDLFI